VAVASAGAYASLHFAPATQHSVFFTGRMPFLPPNQQRQSIEGITECSAVKTSLDLNDARDDRVLAWQ